MCSLMLPGPAPFEVPVIRDVIFLVVVPVSLETQNMAFRIDVDEILFESRVYRHVADPTLLGLNPARKGKCGGQNHPTRKRQAQRPNHASDSKEGSGGGSQRGETLEDASNLVDEEVYSGCPGFATLPNRCSTRHLSLTQVNVMHIKLSGSAAFFRRINPDPQDRPCEANQAAESD